MATAPLKGARWACIVAALSAAGPVLADSNRPDVANGTGDDPTQPLGKIELLDRYTEAPGPGVDEGTTKRVETSLPFAWIEAPSSVFRSPGIFRFTLSRRS